MTAKPAVKSNIVDTPPVAVDVASVPAPPASAPSAAPPAVVDTKKSLFAEEVKGFGVTPAPRPASSTANSSATVASEPSTSTIAPLEAQPESMVDTSVAPEPENTSTVAAEAPASNAVLLGWD